MRKKKIIITGLAAVSSVAVLGITAFNASSQYRKSFENDVNIDTTSQLETVVHTPTDYTIDIEEHNFTEEEKNKAQKVGCSASFNKSFRELKDLCTNEVAIECEVLTVANTIKDGIPYTKFDVEVTDTLFGNLDIGDKVTVMQIGGYMTLQDEVEAFDNAVKFKDIPKESLKDIIIQKQGERMECPTAGDKYILFMSKDTTVFKGVYFPVNLYEGIYKFDPETKLYVRNMPEEIISDIDNISLEDLKTKCAECLDSM